MTSKTHTCEDCSRTFDVTVNSRCPVCATPIPDHLRLGGLL